MAEFVIIVVFIALVAVGTLLPANHDIKFLR
jgi:hypothetical protein